MGLLWELIDLSTLSCCIHLPFFCKDLCEFMYEGLCKCVCVLVCVIWLWRESENTCARFKFFLKLWGCSSHFYHKKNKEQFFARFSHCCHIFSIHFLIQWFFLWVFSLYLDFKKCLSSFPTSKFQLLLKKS